MSESQKIDYMTAGEKDKQLQMLKEYIKKGWPKEKRHVHESVKCYFGFQEELSEQDNIFFKGDKIIIPHSKINEVLNTIHSNHIGI